MKNNNFGLLFSASMLIGILGLACAAGDTIEGTPSGGAGTTGTGNTTGAAGTTGTGNTTGAAGTTGRGGTTGAGNTTGAAGTTGRGGTTGTGNVTGAAGSPVTGAAGTTGTGNVTGAAGSPVTGAAGTTGTFVMNCTPASPLISDLEDGNYYFGQTCPKGGWYLSTGGGGTVTAGLASGASGNVIPVASDTSMKAIHVAGSGQMNTTATSYDAFVSLSASLNSPSATDTGSVNATTYTGITFKGKITSGTTGIRIQVSNAYTHPKGMMCTTGTTQCYDHPGAMLTNSASWMTYMIPFSSLMQEGFGNISPSGASFPKTALYTIEFKVVMPATGAVTAWDMWIDDLGFY